MFIDNLENFFSSVHPFSRKALEHSFALGIPSRKNENWKYTPLNKLKESEFKKISQSSFAITQSSGIEISNEAINWDEDFGDFFTAYNKATLNNVYQIKILNTGKEEFLNLNLNIMNSEYASFYVRIELEKGARLQILEKLKIHGFLNIHIEILLNEDAQCEHLRTVEGESSGSFATHHLESFLNKNSLYRHVQVGTGLTTYRQNIECDLKDQGSRGEVLGFNNLKQDMSIDNNIHSNHHVGSTISRQFFKTILSDKSKSVFQGRIFIDKNAQKSDAEQLNKNLMLSPNSEVDTKPQLDVFADDVKANHGATIGQIGSEELFYLQSRGLSYEQSMELLTSAYGLEVVQNINSKNLRQEALSFLSKPMSKEA